jgi:hypothetical protein
MLEYELYQAPAILNTVEGGQNMTVGWRCQYMLLSMCSDAGYGCFLFGAKLAIIYRYFLQLMPQ